MTLVVSHAEVVVIADDGSVPVGSNEWNANHVLTGVVSPSQGGTGVANNDASTLTVTGNFPVAFTVGASTALTLPVSGTVATVADVAAASVSCLMFVIDGGGAPITTGVKGDLYIPFGCTITEWTILADQSGSIVVDIWKDTYANYPPTVADTITAAAKPTVSAAVKGQSSALTGWTTAIAAGNTLRFNVDSVATLTRATIALKVTRT